MKKIIVDSIYLIAIPPSPINSGLCMTECNFSVFCMDHKFDPHSL